MSSLAWFCTGTALGTVAGAAIGYVIGWARGCRRGRAIAKCEPPKLGFLYFHDGGIAPVWAESPAQAIDRLILVSRREWL